MWGAGCPWVGWATSRQLPVGVVKPYCRGVWQLCGLCMPRKRGGHLVVTILLDSSSAPRVARCCLEFVYIHVGVNIT